MVLFATSAVLSLTTVQHIAPASEEFQSRLARFQHDESLLVANFTTGMSASFDPSSDGGGLGDVLNIVVSQASSALSHGCRYHSPHVVRGSVWRYAAVAARAGLCTESDGWNCIFKDTFPPLPSDDAGWKTPQEDEMHTFAPDLSASCKRDDALRRHGLDELHPPEGLCPVDCRLSVPDAVDKAACGRTQLSSLCDGASERCNRHPVSISHAELVAPLLSQPQYACERAAWTRCAAWTAVAVLPLAALSLAIGN